MLSDTISPEELRESLAFLKMINRGKKDIEGGRTRPFRESFRHIRKVIDEKKSTRLRQKIMLG